MSHNHSNHSLSWIFIGAGLIIFGSALWFALDQEPLEKKTLTVPVATDFPAPALTLIDLNGKSNSLAASIGKVILVNLWATWCPPCKAEMPALNDFFLKHRSEGFVIIGINDGEPEKLVRNFVDAFELKFPIWLDPNYSAEKAYGTIGLPSSYAIDRSGTVRLMWFGAVESSTLEKYVSPMLME